LFELWLRLRIRLTDHSLNTGQRLGCEIARLVQGGFLSSFVGRQLGWYDSRHCDHRVQIGRINSENFLAVAYDVVNIVQILSRDHRARIRIALQFVVRIRQGCSLLRSFSYLGPIFRGSVSADGHGVCVRDALRLLEVRYEFLAQSGFLDWILLVKHGYVGIVFWSRLELRLFFLCQAWQRRNHESKQQE